MCIRSSSPKAEVNTPKYSVAQMGDNYQLTTKPTDPEESEDEGAKARKASSSSQPTTQM